MLKNFLSLMFLLTLFISCSTTITPIRFPSSSSTDEINYYLSIDKFKYYLNEYTLALDGKIPDTITNALKKITVEDIIEMHLSSTDLFDANNYDEIIYKYLLAHQLTENLKRENLKWNYNFFRTKLNEAFTLVPSKLSLDLSIHSEEKTLITETDIIPELLNPDDMTLDSGHYISNRTTRAIFWESIKNQRRIEFFLGDSREFLKNLKEQRGEILFEVKPLAKNYNKIFIIKYPSNNSYVYAITNIGGHDRLNHLINQLSLSNIHGKSLDSKIIVKGNLKKFHDAKTEEHTLQLKLLPKADRVIIGQKESIDGKFFIFWKMRALKILYDEDPDLFKKTLKISLIEKYSDMEVPPLDKSKKPQNIQDVILSFQQEIENKFLTLNDAAFETIFKEKKFIEDTYLLFQKEFENNTNFSPPKFKIYNYDNFTIEMCDYLFRDPEGKNIRWRVISNVWGDEIIPIAKALKNTGHHNIVYMGTAGAFAGKGFKVGDLVIPNSVHDGTQKLLVKSDPMKIDGAKYGGSVEHVGSPFDESEEWLKMTSARSEMVEVETLYLRQIFNGSQDNVEMYLLISDILGSESETLAHATSSKRKNMQNKLLAALFSRDSKGIPTPVLDAAISEIEEKRNFIFHILAKKSNSYRYFAYSSLKDSKDLTEKDILKFAEENPSFSDSYVLDRLVKISELVHEMNKKLKGKVEFDIAFSKNLVEGKWNPKNHILQVSLRIKNADASELAQEALDDLNDQLDQVNAFAHFSIKESLEKISNIPDEVGAYKKSLKKILLNGQEMNAYIIRTSEYKHIPDGTILYNHLTNERIVKNKSTMLDDRYGHSNLAFLEDQIPAYRTKFKESGDFLPVSLDPKNIPDIDMLPATFNLEISNIKISGNKDRIILLTTKKFSELPSGTLIYNLGSSYSYEKSGQPIKKVARIGKEMIDLYSDFEGETNWGVKISQFPSNRFDEDGYFIPFRKKQPTTLLKTPLTHLIFEEKKSAYNELGECIYFITKENYKSLPNGVVLYHPSGKKFIKGFDTLPKDSDLGRSVWKKIGFREIDIPIEQIKKNGKPKRVKYVAPTSEVATKAIANATDESDLIWMKTPDKTDQDFFVKIYSQSGLKNAGLYSNVTYNGNLTLDFLPTSKVEKPLEAFYQGANFSTAKEITGTCFDAMKALMTMFQ
jgi:hypothetical protein